MAADAEISALFPFNDERELLHTLLHEMVHLYCYCIYDEIGYKHLQAKLFGGEARRILMLQEHKDDYS